jgi:hypothetical protein
MSYKCKGKRDVLRLLSYMIVYAPDFRDDAAMTLDIAFGDLEDGFQLLEQGDGRPALIEVLVHMRELARESRALFDLGEINPACHKLQALEEVLKPVRVKGAVA